MSKKKSNDNNEKGDERVSIEGGAVGVLGEDGVRYDNENEVFHKTSDGIDYRTVGRKRAMFVIYKGKSEVHVHSAYCVSCSHKFL
jgi:hypothetical protein